MKRIYWLALLFIASSALGQSADFITLKKRNKTIKTYFKGSHFNFVGTNGSRYQTVIDDIRKDSLFLSEYVIVQMPTRLGVYVLDTAARYRYKFHYNEVRSIFYDKRGFSWSNSGYSLMGGSALLLVGSGVVYLADRSNFSLPLLGAAAGLGAVGYLLTRAQNTNFVIGKKYSLHYIAINKS